MRLSGANSRDRRRIYVIRRVLGVTGAGQVNYKFGEEGGIDGRQRRRTQRPLSVRQWEEVQEVLPVARQLLPDCPLSRPISATGTQGARRTLGQPVRSQCAIPPILDRLRRRAAGGAGRASGVSASGLGAASAHRSC